jgi:hypothetical protein
MFRRLNGRIVIARSSESLDETGAPKRVFAIRDTFQICCSSALLPSTEDDRSTKDVISSVRSLRAVMAVAIAVVHGAAWFCCESSTIFSAETP